MSELSIRTKTVLPSMLTTI